MTSDEQTQEKIAMLVTLNKELVSLVEVLGERMLLLERAANAAGKMIVRHERSINDMIERLEAK